MIFFFFDRGFEHLRQPDRAPRCYELTDTERVEKAAQLRSLSPKPHISQTKDYAAIAARSGR